MAIAKNGATEQVKTKIYKIFQILSMAMRKNIFYFLSGIILGLSGALTHAATVTSATVPEGMITFSLPHGTSTLLSLPLSNNVAYTSSVTAVTDTSITVGDSPAPFTGSLTTPASPYFVKFLSGNERGRVMQITSNTASSLTLNTTDGNLGSPVFLTTANFNVQVGDTFEIFPGDTLASIFGAGTTQSPLTLTGGTSVIFSDTISVYTTSTAPALTYYFNTTNGYWEQYGTTANANNTIIYPYSALAIERRGTHPDTTLVVGGRVTSVASQIKVVGDGTVYASSHYASAIKLSQLQFGSNWTTGSSVIVADILSVWDPAIDSFDTYYQKPDSTWRKYPDSVTDQSNSTIAPGVVLTITKRSAVTGGASFLQSSLPYSLD